MRNQLARFASMGVFLATLAACRAGGTLVTYTATYPPVASSGAGIPISLIDQAGVVTGFAVAPEDPGEPGVEAVSGSPGSLRVTWLAGACVDRVAMVLNPVGEGYQLTIHNHEGIAAAFCSGEGFAHAVDVDLKVSVEPRDVSLDIVYP